MGELVLVGEIFSPGRGCAVENVEEVYETENIQDIFLDLGREVVTGQQLLVVVCGFSSAYNPVQAC